MARSENKTKQTRVAPRTFLKAVESERRRKDGLALLEFFNRVTETQAAHVGRVDRRLWPLSLQV